MGLFGGSSSKRTTTNQTDNRAINQAENAINGDGNHFNVIDGGAIDLAGKLAGIHAESMGETFKEASALSTQALSNSNTALGTVAELSGQHADSMKDVLGKYADNVEFLGEHASSAYAGALETMKDNHASVFSTISDNNRRAFDVINNATTSSNDKGLKSVQVMALAVVAGVVIMGVFRR